MIRSDMSVDHAYPYYKEIVALTADFVVCKGDKVEEVYQVSYDLTKEKTRAREIIWSTPATTAKTRHLASFMAFVLHFDIIYISL